MAIIIITLIIIYIYKFWESAWAVKSHRSGSGRYVWRFSVASSERRSKLQLKLNGNYSSLCEILAPSLCDHNGSLRADNFSN